MDTWEAEALEYRYPEDGASNAMGPLEDPLIYPSIYCPSGIDMMGIMFRITSRVNPKVVLGAVDSSVSLIVCDLLQPDYPIVYVTDAFTKLTGYEPSDVLGHNPRLLQAPDGKVRRGGPRGSHVDVEKVKKMRKAVDRHQEIQLRVVNYRRSGRKFTNLLSIIPIQWDTEEYRYSVGFMAEG